MTLPNNRLVKYSDRRRNRQLQRCDQGLCLLFWYHLIMFLLSIPVVAVNFVVIPICIIESLVFTHYTTSFTSDTGQIFYVNTRTMLYLWKFILYVEYQIMLFFDQTGTRQENEHDNQVIKNEYVTK